ncbi:MAG: DNA polymerase III subunit beta, partial [Clostridia bacterium]|nr:DNA polymerase III subunit beta [Clostridia bacterium]
ISMEHEDYPDIDDVQGGNVAYIKSGKMRDAVSKVMFAVSTDESRKILTGVLTEIYPSEMVFVGLDGFRLAMQTVQQENKLPEKSPDKISCVIPGRIMNEIKSMLPDDDETEAEIVFSSSRCMISFGSVRVYASLLTGEFIDYQRILPKTWTTEITVNRGSLSNAVDRCNLMAREGKNNLIHFSVKKEGVLMMNANSEKGEVRDQIPIQFEGNEIDIAFNSKYLMDVIHNISADEMCLCFNTNVSPCMVKPTEGRSYTFLLLPVRIFGR